MDGKRWLLVAVVLDLLVVRYGPRLTDHLATPDNPQPTADSVQLDSLFAGPHYEFTGNEDPSLLAAVFAETFQLGKADAGGLARPSVYCLATGTVEQADAPPSVIRLLQGHERRVAPASACELNGEERFYAVAERATGRRGWLVRISALRTVSDTIVLAYSDFYVEPLFAAGWLCTFARRPSGWQPTSCSMRWIS